MSDYRLGKKVPPAAPGPKEDVIERVGNVWKVNGKFQTNPPQPEDPFKHMREMLRRAQQQQEEDGYPNIYWGSF